MHGNLRDRLKGTGKLRCDEGHSVRASRYLAEIMVDFLGQLALSSRIQTSRKKMGPGALHLELTAGVDNPPPPGIAASTDLTRFHSHLPLTALDQASGWPIPWLKGEVAHNRMNGFARVSERALVIYMP